jgi:glycosyltransferase involved in cell wall biosynthesis
MTATTAAIAPAGRTGASVDVSWPRITVITPSFNQAQYLEQTILSVLNQGYPNLEYMIIDGGSADGSVELIRKYEKSLAYWVSEPDRGQTHAINKGLERATGELIAYLNSDDYYLPGALRRVAEEYIARPEADLFYGKCRIIDETGARTDQRTGSISSYEEIVDLWGVWWRRRNFVQPEVFWTKRITERIGLFREELHFVMDYEYWTRMFRCGSRSAFIDDEISCFRLHREQKSTQAESSVAEQLRVLRPLLWDKSADISFWKRQFLKGLWLYDAIFLKAVRTSLERGDSRLKRFASLLILTLKHPRLLVVKAFRQRMLGAMTHKT